MITSGGNRKPANADNQPDEPDNHDGASSQQPYRQPTAALNATDPYELGVESPSRYLSLAAAFDELTQKL